MGKQLANVWIDVRDELPPNKEKILILVQYFNNRSDKLSNHTGIEFGSVYYHDKPLHDGTTEQWFIRGSFMESYGIPLAWKLVSRDIPMQYKNPIRSKKISDYICSKIPRVNRVDIVSYFKTDKTPTGHYYCINYYYGENNRRIIEYGDNIAQLMEHIKRELK